MPTRREFLKTGGAAAMLPVFPLPAKNFVMKCGSSSGKSLCSFPHEIIIMDEVEPLPNLFAAYKRSGEAR